MLSADLPRYPDATKLIRTGLAHYWANPGKLGRGNYGKTVGNSAKRGAAAEMLKQGFLSVLCVLLLRRRAGGQQVNSACQVAVFEQELAEKVEQSLPDSFCVL